MNNFLLLVYLGLATSAISVTLTRSGIMREPRDWLRTRFPSLKGLVHCPYCTSHWIAAILVVIYRPIPFPTFMAADLIVSAMAIVGVAAIVTGVAVTTIPSLSYHKEGKQGQ